MALLNLTVLYFAFGSPLGVYQMTPACRVRSGQTAAAVVFRFVLWPIFALALFRDWISSIGVTSDLDRQIEGIRGRFESIAFTGNSAALIFEFREIFSRFAGLTAEVHRREWRQNELFVIANHGNVELASTCLARRNSRRLAFHRMRARGEFETFIADLAQSHPNGDEIMELGRQLTESINSEP